MIVRLRTLCGCERVMEVPDLHTAFRVPILLPILPGAVTDSAEVGILHRHFEIGPKRDPDGMYVFVEKRP